ncbi:hypothetical protein VTO42DRAFT_8078 [Malbranchea cinnamomea]
MEHSQSHSMGEGTSTLNLDLDDNVICVDEHGSEPGEVRFPRGGDKLPPRIATWRNNLTALSQHRNLYFVACATQVHVYQPSGYGQMIGSTPSLVLTPPMKYRDAPGYISVHVPHAINSILVSDLGQEEILLLATDSGNVAAYRTEHVYAAIEENKHSIDRLHPEAAGSQVECFFHDWVGLSAWGLAIHKFARLIAVSSNTSYITVFAFALVEKPGDSDSGDETPATRLRQDADSEWISISSPSQYAKLRSWSHHRRRSRNLRLTLTGHATNIPNVSFLNSDLDSEGNWLFSTDIDNKLLAWRIWDRPKPVHSWDFRPAHGVSAQGYRRDYQRGWNVLAIDPRVFRAKNSVAEACGGPPAQVSDPDRVLDLSLLGQCIPGSNRYYDFFPPMDLPGPNSCPFPLGGPPSDESFSGSFDDSFPDCLEDAETLNTDPVIGESDAEPTPESTRQNQAHDGRRSPFSASVSENSSEDISDSESAEAEPAQSLAGLLPHINPLWEMITGDVEADEDEDELFDLDAVGELLSDMQPPLEESQEVPEDVDSPEPMSDDRGSEGSEIELARHDETTMTQRAANLLLRSARDAIFSRVFENTENNLADLAEVFNEFPILHFSETHVRMIPSPFSRNPSIIYKSPLYQEISEPMPLIETCDRFNMMHHIPELGVVVAASQKGRVAIISLTQVQGEGMFFRVDKIVPFDYQERFGLRPLCPLLGIAVGPVEGHLIPPDDPNWSGYRREAWHGSEFSRRYRLLLMYADHSVLHYELYYDWPRDMRGPEGKLVYDSAQPFLIRP